MSEQDEDPKLIVDEDWKAKVEREKKELEEQKANEPAESNSVADEIQKTDSTEAGPSEQPSENRESSQPLPPASLQMLVAGLATQAMASLGLVPGEDGQPLPVSHDFAKHFIDLVGVVEEKTKGNLSQDESEYLRDTLYQLRMAFVQVNKPK